MDPSAGINKAKHCFDSLLGSTQTGSLNWTGDVFLGYSIDASVISAILYTVKYSIEFWLTIGMLPGPKRWCQN